LTVPNRWSSVTTVAGLNKNTIKNKARRVFDPIVSGLASFGVSPFLVSLAGLVLSLYGAWVLAGGSLFWGGVWLIFAGVADILDGGLARHRGVESKFGAFIDSTFDRISELAYFSALIFYYIERPHGYSLLDISLVCVVLSGSILTSYARARLEGLGYSCTVGLMERPERLALLIVGLLLGRHVLTPVLVVIAVGSMITVLQRIYHGWRVTRERPAQTHVG
jgi:CDP-diacylglycerol--glycerol-3-phosphate 3-phosphatidyltransferase